MIEEIEAIFFVKKHFTYKDSMLLGSDAATKIIFEMIMRPKVLPLSKYTRNISNYTVPSFDGFDSVHSYRAYVLFCQILHFDTFQRL